MYWSESVPAASPHIGISLRETLRRRYAVMISRSNFIFQFSVLRYLIYIICLMGPILVKIGSESEKKPFSHGANFTRHLLRGYSFCVPGSAAMYEHRHPTIDTPYEKHRPPVRHSWIAYAWMCKPIIWSILYKLKHQISGDHIIFSASP